jgi:hypothetical protein
MRIHVGTLSFESPPGFRDVTGYEFKSPDGEELCDVGGGPLPVGVDDLDGLVKDRRSDIDDGMPGFAIIEGTNRTVLAGLPAQTLTIGILDDEARRREWWTLALDTRATYIQISYAARADNDLAEARFLHVVASASFTLAATPTPPGYVRRWAGKLWIDIPSHLVPPRTYQFLSTDETMKLEVWLLEGDAAEPSIESEIEQDSAHGEEVRDQTSSDIAVGDSTGTLHAYHLTRTEDDILVDDAVRRAHVRRDGAPVAHVFGRAPSIDEAALEAAIRDLIESISRSERP